MSTAVTAHVAATLEEARAQDRAALIGYLPLGFPTVDLSVQAAQAMVESGVDVIELGLPYSDPVMDGPVIQNAVDAALQGGVRVADVFGAVRRIAQSGAPVEVMTYFNPVLRYGVDRFASDLAAAGGSGLITPDLIPEEAGEWIEAAEAHDLDRIFLVAPSSSQERLAVTARATRGFVYAASTMGITGTRESVGEQAQKLVADTRRAGAQHVCVGLGVSNGEQAHQIARYADGVIVGSALVRTLAEMDPDAPDFTPVQQVVADLAAGVRR
ncbi:MAG TPA: tryptophan synthase subunit alpha [Ruania sp.]|nr:tryptophan synthase subunit alpha [Ruania sp.]